MQDSNERSNKSKFKRYTELAFQYHIAAASLWISITEAPYLFNPCMFLAIHTIELLIKGRIYRDCDVKPETRISQGKNKKTVDSTHALSSLWSFYLDEKQPCLFPDVAQLERIEKAIRTISFRDIESTKFRYPEMKITHKNLTLEPIKIIKDACVYPEISSKRPALKIKPKRVDIISSGQKSLMHGQEVFDLIEELFQLAEQ